MIDVHSPDRERRGAVLVTGGAGYIGSHTCKALAAHGYVPITYDNFVHGHRWAVRWGPVIEADVGDFSALRAAFDEFEVSAVIHFAGYAYVGESMSVPGKYFRNNVANTVTLLEAMASANVKNIVFSSSCATYGTPTEVPIREDMPQRPINPYGQSKLIVEQMLQSWSAAQDLRWSALRYFNAAGADAGGAIGEDHCPETHLIPLAIMSALEQREALDIYGSDYATRDGTAIRDYVHVSDLAEAHVRALRRLESGGGNMAVNLGTGSGCTVREVVAMVEQVSGRTVPVREVARRPGDPPELVACVDRARELLDWDPRYSSLKTIVETAWAWHSANHQALGNDRSNPAAAEI